MMFIGHSTIVYERECQRNPDWKDFLPETDGTSDTDGPRVPVRRLWQELRNNLVADGIPVTVSSNRLQTRHRQWLSVIWPRRGITAAPHKRITVHISALKTRDPAWTVLRYGWASPEMRHSDLMYHAVSELIGRIGYSNSFVAFTNQGWYASLLSSQFAFRATSPSMLPVWLRREYIPGTACYVRNLRRS